jgi:FkbM family methyltransferase
MFIKEPQTCEWIKSEVKAGQVFYDIGANIGIYSILAAKYVGGLGRVYAFEPHNANFSRLLDNIAANGLGEIVVPCNLALYSRDEFFALRLSDRPGRIIRQPTSFSDRK